MKVILINGTAGVGKTTFIDLCRRVNPLVRDVSSIDFVKEIAFACGWNGEKNDKNRKFLCDLKNLLSEWGDVPNRKIHERMMEHPERIYFITVREPADLERLRLLYHAPTVLVTNNRVPLNTSNMADAHVYDYIYDYNIYNNGGMDELYDLAQRLMRIVTESEVEEA